MVDPAAAACGGKTVTHSIMAPEDSRHPDADLLARFVHALVDFVLPPRCLICGRWLSSSREGRLCVPCTALFAGAGSPLCPRCGALFASREGGDHLCGRCLRQRLFFDAARTLSRYEGSVRETVHRLKYRGHTMLAGPLGKLMADRGRVLLPADGCDLIVPVPLHVRRLRERGYNQSALLARSIGSRWGVRVDSVSLCKTRWTPPQTALTVSARRVNLRGAFSWRGAPLRGARVVLVDDVATSGSTMNECARVLKQAGAARVDVLTLARTQEECFR